MTEKMVNHRQRLRDSFIKDPDTLSDERILELLLTYGIPQKDVYPLACELIAAFGSLSGVLDADMNDLVQYKGIKGYSSILIKLVDYILKKHMTQEDGGIAEPIDGYKEQLEVEEETIVHEENKDFSSASKRTGTGLFSKAMLGESIKILPGLPDTESLKEIRDFLKSNLAFNSEQTRSRNANYIIRRMFKNGKADRALRIFARYFAGKQEVRDVCYYRFCKVEPLMAKITEDLFVPALISGTLARNIIKDYLHKHYPHAKNINDCVQAIAEALRSGGIAKVTRDTIYVTYRDINIASFAFILHSEFPDPGIYDIKLLERSEVVKLMLWQPEGLLPALFELRNQGILSKVSEIDNVRQFTSHYSLEQLVDHLTAGGKKDDRY